MRKRIVCSKSPVRGNSLTIRPDGTVITVYNGYTVRQQSDLYKGETTLIQCDTETEYKVGSSVLIVKVKDETRIQHRDFRMFCEDKGLSYRKLCTEHGIAHFSISGKIEPHELSSCSSIIGWLIGTKNPGSNSQSHYKSVSSVWAGHSEQKTSNTKEYLS